MTTGRRAEESFLGFGKQQLQGFLLSALVGAFVWLVDGRRNDAMQEQYQADKKESVAQAVHSRDRELDNLHSEVRDLQGRCHR